MALVSIIYQRAGTEGAWASREETELRLRALLRRLIDSYGREEVLRRLYEFQTSAEHQVLRRWLIARAETMPEQSGRQGTL